MISDHEIGSPAYSGVGGARCVMAGTSSDYFAIYIVEYLQAENTGPLTQLMSHRFVLGEMKLGGNLK